MAKKKQITDSLSALKPGIPTSTRKKTPPPESSIEGSGPIEETSPIAGTSPVEATGTIEGTSLIEGASPDSAHPVDAPGATPSIAVAAIVKRHEFGFLTETPAGLSAGLVEQTTAVPSEATPVSIIVKETRPGYLSLVAENITALEKVREVLIEEMGKINGIMLDAWRQSMIITYDVFKMNQEYLFKIISQSFTANNPGDKKRGSE